MIATAPLAFPSRQAAHEALMAAVEALDVAQVRDLLDRGALARSGRNNDAYLFNVLWRAGHREELQDCADTLLSLTAHATQALQNLGPGAQAAPTPTSTLQLPRRAFPEEVAGRYVARSRRGRAAQVLMLLCAGGANPLQDPQLALSPFIADWEMRLDLWHTLEDQCLAQGLRNETGGGWLHTLCTNGAYHTRAIAQSLERRGWTPGVGGVMAPERRPAAADPAPPVQPESPPAWLTRDDEGLTPLDRLWSFGGWEQRGLSPTASQDLTPTLRCLDVTAWCVAQGLDPLAGDTCLADRLLAGVGWPVFRGAPAEVVRGLVAQWRETRLQAVVADDRDQADEDGSGRRRL